MDSRNYYSLAHSTLEIIKEQPKSLVGGTLKEYQVRNILALLLTSLVEWKQANPLVKIDMNGWKMLNFLQLFFCSHETIFMT